MSPGANRFWTSCSGSNPAGSIRVRRRLPGSDNSSTTRSNSSSSRMLNNERLSAAHSRNWSTSEWCRQMAASTSSGDWLLIAIARPEELTCYRMQQFNRLGIARPLRILAIEECVECMGLGLIRPPGPGRYAGKADLSVPTRNSTSPHQRQDNRTPHNGLPQRRARQAPPLPSQVPSPRLSRAPPSEASGPALHFR